MVFLLLSAPVRADPRPSAIVLAFDETSDAQKRAVAAIRAHVQDLPLEVQVAPVEPQSSLAQRLAESGELAASRGAFGTFYVDLADDSSLLIFFTESGGEATLIRRLPPNPQGLRVALEQAAIVVRSLVEALLDGGGVGIGPAEAGQPSNGASAAAEGRIPTSPQAAPSATVPPEPPTAGARAVAPAGGRRLALTAGGAVASFAAEAPWQGGLSLGAHWLAQPALYLAIRYTLFPALTLSSLEAELSVQRHPFELSVGYREPGRLGLAGEVGVLVDRAVRTTASATAPFQPTPPDARWTVGVGARGGFSWSPWEPMWVSLRVGGDFLLTPFSYSIESTRALRSPRRVRPRVELELAVWMW